MNGATTYGLQFKRDNGRRKLLANTGATIRRTVGQQNCCNVFGIDTKKKKQPPKKKTNKIQTKSKWNPKQIETKSQKKWASRLADSFWISFGFGLIFFGPKIFLGSPHFLSISQAKIRRNAACLLLVRLGLRVWDCPRALIAAVCSMRFFKTFVT